jgi:Flp pilus assembly protein TadG
MAAVEFAMVLPFLLGILALTVDFGRMGFDRTTVANAARLGASVASQNPVGEDRGPWEERVRARVEEELSQLVGFDANSLKLSVEVVEVQGVPAARVELTYPFRTFFDWPLVGGEIPITQTVISPMADH